MLLVMDGYPGSGHYASFGPGDQSSDPASGDQYFGLSEFVRSLTGPLPFLSHFAVTTAHRDTDVGHAAEIENFRFDQHNLSQYDEIWLFGVAGPGETNTPMSDAELAALATFMDGGGGVFATGDHENLGVELNGRVPRVRSMRKWYWPAPGPNGEPAAPPALGSNRIETTQPGHGEPDPASVFFDDQSDDIPQPITPRWYFERRSVLFGWRYPHPLLCGPKGTITVLPDHMHEGEVITPWDLGASLTFAGKTFVEYPTVSGRQPAPEIVAWGRVLPETDTATEPAHVGDPTDIANPRTFGVVGAYDGHGAGVGCVAVDSTWHHFFDINLIGDPIAPAPKNQGFRASLSGQAALADIESYYRNIAVWIARPQTHARLFAAAAWFALRTQPLNMLVTPGRKFSYPEMMSVGALALQNLFRVFPPCATLQIFIKQYVEGPGPIPLPDPWANPPGDPPPGDPSLFAQAGLAGAIIALAQERSKIKDMQPAEAAGLIQHTARTGMLEGLRQFGADVARYGEGLATLGRKLSAEETTNPR